MTKSDKETIEKFNEQVNMTAVELEKWLEDPQSKEAGTGVGLESAKRIIEILKKNPNKEADKYDKVSDQVIRPFPSEPNAFAGRS
jgi:hypothetical protein